MTSIERTKRKLGQAIACFLMAEEAACSKRIEELMWPPFTTLAEIAMANAVPPPFGTPSEITLEDWTQRLNDLAVPVDRMELDLPEYAFPQSCALARLEQMSDDEIRNFVDGNPSFIAVQLALHELAMRRIDRATRPHWSVESTFRLVVFSTVIGAIGLIISGIGVYLM